MANSELHKQQGRPISISPENLVRIQRLAARGVKHRRIAALMGLSRPWVSRLLAKH
jgi:DNA-binding transcriptional regulator LsrR (DeoR family)